MINTGSRAGLPVHGMLARRRARQWTPQQRALLIMLVAVVMGSLFVTTYSLALGNPVPHPVAIGLVDGRAADPLAIMATESELSNT